MKGVKEQRLGVSVFYILLFLAGGLCMFWIAAEAYKSGVARIIGGRDGITKLYKENSPESYWVCVSIYVLAGLGCMGGTFQQLGHIIRKLRLPRLHSNRR